MIPVSTPAARNAGAIPLIAESIAGEGKVVPALLASLYRSTVFPIAANTSTPNQSGRNPLTDKTKLPVWMRQRLRRNAATLTIPAQVAEGTEMDR
jgi:hypothetical protein